MILYVLIPIFIITIIMIASVLVKSLIFKTSEAILSNEMNEQEEIKNIMCHKPSYFEYCKALKASTRLRHMKDLYDYQYYQCQSAI